MTRTNQKHHRAYVNGYDLSGYARALPTMGSEYDVSPEAALSDAVMNITQGRAKIMADTLNCMLDNDTAGAFALLSSGSVACNLACAIGTNAAPVAGDPVFAWEMQQMNYKGENGSGFVVANVGFADPYSTAVVNYDKPWGVLLHPKGAETGVNSDTGVDDIGGSSTAGGIFFYHLFSSNGTLTLSVEHADTNLDGSFGALTGATSGSIDASVTPASDFVAISTTETVEQFLRWQLALGTATTATFMLGFIRAND